MYSQSKYNIPDLITRCLRDNRKAQNQMFTLYSEYLMAVVKRYVKDDYNAKAIFLSSFEKIFRKLDQFNSELGEFKYWIRRIAINESLSHIKSQKKFEEIEDHSRLYLDTEIDWNRSIDMKRVYEVIKSLKFPYGIIFNLVMEGYKHREIAQQLDITEGTSRSYYKRSKAMIRSKLLMLNTIVSDEQRI